MFLAVRRKGIRTRTIKQLDPLSHPQSKWI